MAKNINSSPSPYSVLLSFQLLRRGKEVKEEELHKHSSQTTEETHPNSSSSTTQCGVEPYLELTAHNRAGASQSVPHILLRSQHSNCA